MYVLLSGYFYEKTKFSIKKLLRVYAQVVFYAITLYAVMCIIGRQDFSWGVFIKRLFPISTSAYWFITCWSALFMLSPGLNFFIQNSSKLLFRKTLSTLIIIFSVWNCFRVDPIGVGSGYCLYWFICMYLVGGYICKYKEDFRCKEMFLLIYFASAALTVAGVFILNWGGVCLLGQPCGDSLLWGYNAPLVFVNSVALFCWFMQINVPDRWQGIILLISPATLGIYLLHMNLDLFKIGWKICHATEYTESLWYLPHMLLVCLVIYIFGIMIEFMRRKSFFIVENIFVENKEK